MNKCDYCKKQISGGVFRFSKIFCNEEHQDKYLKELKSKQREKVKRYYLELFRGQMSANEVAMRARVPSFLVNKFFKNYRDRVGRTFGNGLEGDVYDIVLKGALSAKEDNYGQIDWNNRYNYEEAKDEYPETKEIDDKD